MPHHRPPCAPTLHALAVAHTCSFDVRRVGGALAALGFTPPPTWASLDTQWLAKASFNQQPWDLDSGNTWKDNTTPSFSLQVLEQQLGVTRHGDAHRCSIVVKQGSKGAGSLAQQGQQHALVFQVCYSWLRLPDR